MSAAKRTRVVFLWHMHQPPYRSPLSGEYLLPWVLLHAMRDYYDMPLLARETDGARMTFNLSPSLVQQLEDYAAGTNRDVFLAAAMRPPADLTPEGRRFLVENFFSVHPETMLKPHERYAQLADKLRTAPSPEARVARFDDQELMDLQVWFFLAWAGRSLRRDPRVAELLRRGRDFRQEDKHLLREAVLEQLRRTLPLYRELQDEGRIEVSTSPMYHPILPLLVSMESALEATPELRLPLSRFGYARDAGEQVHRALRFAAEKWGRPVAGLWPPEAAVSQPVLRTLGEEGVRWVAADEKVLARSLAASGTPRARGETLYTPWRHGDTTLFFRDAVLSDLIGFVYSRWETGTAVDHFVSELAKASARSSLDSPVVTIAMDGENAWEYYVNDGYDFLEVLYRRLARDDRFELTTPSAILEEGEACPVLERVSAGTWIDGTFATWIGDPVKNRAWEHLSSARATAASSLVHRRLEPRETDELVDLLHRAEASDWFWWMGASHSSAYDVEFDLLFRQHLKAIYRKVGQQAPPELDWPLSRPTGSLSRVELPVHRISPAITGKRDGYYKWLSAGRAELVQGFFHRPRTVVSRLLFGFDAERLYFEIESHRPLGPLMRERRVSFHLTFVNPVHREIRLWVDAGGRERVTCLETGKDCPLSELAAGSVLELALPFALMEADGVPAGPGTLVELYVIVARKGMEMERFPQTENVVFTIRGEELDVENWHV